MDEIIVCVLKYVVSVQLFHGGLLCNCLPIFNVGGSNALGAPGVLEWQWTTGVLTLTVAVCLIVVVIGCLCCQHRKGFQPQTEEITKDDLKKEFTNASVGSLTTTDVVDTNDPGLVNPIIEHQFTIFRPITTAATTSPQHHNNNKQTASAGFKRIAEANVQPNDDINYWFADTNDFPRNQLKFIRELGHGWFGRIIYGEATDDNTAIPVVVRTLETTNKSEITKFLTECRIYFRNDHLNIMPLYGKSLKLTPFLIIQPYYEYDVKSYLLKGSVLEEDVLKWGPELIEGVNYLHQRDIAHPDLALRNSRLNIGKSLVIGDYGNSLELYPKDYYPGNPAIPVRWCAPEDLICTPTTIQPKPARLSSNIWSLGITLWELANLGKLPYNNLTDDEVIEQKLTTILPEPNRFLNYYNLYLKCCTLNEVRPKIADIVAEIPELAFEEKWNNSKPNWLENVEGDSSYVEGLGQVINDLDNALELEGGSSGEEMRVDFKLGPISDKTLTQPDVMQDDSLMDSILIAKSNSDSETEDETWKRRIERGAYSEKVRIKSKSVADLMVLTHIDCDDTTDTETPLTSLNFDSNSLNKTFGSDTRLNAIQVQDEFQQELKKLQFARRDSLLFVPIARSEPEEELPSEIPVLNIISASAEDLSVIADLDHPFHVFLQKREEDPKTVDSNENLIENLNQNISKNESQKPTISEDITPELETELEVSNSQPKTELITSSESQNSVTLESKCDKQNTKTVPEKITSKVTFEVQTSESSTTENPFTTEVQNDSSDLNSTFVATLETENYPNSNLLQKQIVSLETETEPEQVEDTLELKFKVTESELPDNLKINMELESEPKINEDLFKKQTVTLESEIKLTESEMENKTIDFLETSFKSSSNTSNDDTVEKQNLKTTPDLCKPLIETVELEENKIKPEKQVKSITNDLENTFNVTVAEISESKNEDQLNFDLSGKQSVTLELQENKTEPENQSVTNDSEKTFNITESDSNVEIGFESKNDVKMSEKLSVTFEPESKITEPENQVKTMSNNLKDTFCVTESDLNIAVSSELGKLVNLDSNEKQTVTLESNNQVPSVPNILETTFKVSDSTFAVTSDLENQSQSPLNKTQMVSLESQKQEFENQPKSSLNETQTVTLESENQTKSEQNQLEATFKVTTNDLVDNSTFIESDKQLPNSTTEPKLLPITNHLDHTFKVSESNSGNSTFVTTPENNRIINISDFIKTEISESVNQTKPVPNLESTFKVTESNSTFVVTLEPDNQQTPNLETTFKVSKTSEMVPEINTTFKMTDLQNLEISKITSEESDQTDPNKTKIIEDPNKTKILETVQIHITSASDDSEDISNISDLDATDTIFTSTPFKPQKSSEDPLPESFTEDLDTSPLAEPLEPNHTPPPAYLSTILETTEYDTLNPILDLTSPQVPDKPPEFNVMHFSVILGPCDDYTLDLYSGLKTQNCPPLPPTPDLNSLLTPCDSLEEHAFQTTLTIQSQAQQIVKNVIRDAETALKYPELQNPQQVRDFVDDLIHTAESYVAEYNNSAVSELTVTPQQFDSLEYNADSEKTIVVSEKTVVLGEGEGWYLHQKEEESEDNSYVGFSLDEECVNALRTELAAKLPHAQGPRAEQMQEKNEVTEEWENEPGTSETHDEMLLRYNVFAAPLSPIAEESEEFDCPTPGTTPCCDEQPSTSWSETDTPRQSPIPAGRSSRHRHTPSMDSCCSNDTLFNIEDCLPNEPPADPEKVSLEMFDISEIGSTTRSEGGEGSTQEIQSDYFSPTRNDFLSQIEVSSEVEVVNSLKLANSKTKQENLKNTADIITYDHEGEDYTINDIIEHLEETPEVELQDAPKFPEVQSEDTSKQENSVQDHFLELSFDFKEELTSLKSNGGSGALYQNLEKIIENEVEKMEEKKAATPEEDYTEIRTSPKKMNSFDDDSVLKFYENIPTSPVHDDKIIESLYENIGNPSGPVAYHKLYENIEKSQDFPYELPPDEGGIDLYSDITDIRFSGPAGELMSTSFNSNEDEQEWDSGTDEDRSSSTSGEFVWKEGEHEASVRVLKAPAVVNDEKPLISNEVYSGLTDEDSVSTSSGEDCEEEGLEFIPSAWDSQAAPIKSALRSPDKTLDKCTDSEKEGGGRRGVWFKKQKYHCVYEYPREPDFSPPEEWAQVPPYPTHSIWGTPTAQDLSNFADWELDTENVIDDNGSSEFEFQDDNGIVSPTTSSRSPRRDYYRRPGDLYRLADVVPDIDFATGLSVTDDDFYVTSSSKPFQSSQFFPGNETPMTITEFANDLKKLHSNKYDLTTPDSGIDDLQTPPLESPIEVTSDLGLLRHTRDKLKLDLPPSPTSFKVFNLNEMEVREPSFTTFGKTRFSIKHVDTPTEEEGGKIEVVRGEASLLDSADEDSGIESSTNATLERGVETLVVAATTGEHEAGQVQIHQK